METVTETLYIVKTPKGYLRGSEDTRGGSKPRFGKTWEEAKRYSFMNAKAAAGYHSIDKYTVEEIEVTYKKKDTTKRPIGTFVVDVEAETEVYISERESTCGHHSSVEPKFHIKRPPLGIVPEELAHNRYTPERISDLAAAIARYCEAKLPIKNEWIEEYNRLIKNEKTTQELSDSIQPDYDTIFNAMRDTIIAGGKGYCYAGQIKAALNSKYSTNKINSELKKAVEQGVITCNNKVGGNRKYCILPAKHN